MYRLVIVDDEEDIKEALVKFIDWNSLGYIVVDTFSDAESAMEYISENPIDAVLTDIIMTGATGIDIAKFINTNYPDIKVVILSGYREFEYAKESIESNVYDYLLKPPDPKELYNVFTKLKKELDRTCSQKEIDSLYKEQFVHNVMCGNCDKTQTDRYVTCLSTEIDVSKCFCAFYVFEIEAYEKVLQKWKYEKELFNISITNFIKAETENEDRIVCIHTKDESINVIVLFDHMQDFFSFESTARQCADILCEEFLNVTGIEVSLIKFFVYENIYDLSSRFFKDYNHICNNNITSFDMKQIMEIKKELVTSIFSFQNKNNRYVLEGYIRKLSGFGLDVSRIFIADAFVQIYEIFMGFSINEIDVDFNRLICVQSFDELLEISIGYIDKIWDIFQEKDISPQERLVEKAKKYIYENYNKDISLNDVCDAVFVSPSYLSRVFKRITGVKFIDYLTDIRINKAKELLCDSRYKIHDICIMLGYKNSNYFITLFQKKTGKTPHEYRKHMM